MGKLRYERLRSFTATLQSLKSTIIQLPFKMVHLEFLCTGRAGLRHTLRLPVVSPEAPSHGHRLNRKVGTYDLQYKGDRH